MKRLFITGGSGMLGSHWMEACAEKFTVRSCYLHTPPFIEGDFIKLDLTRREEVQNALDAFKPDIVIHTAAMTHVDQCEEKPESAHAQNVLASENVALAAGKLGARCVYISTDQVFDGSCSFCDETKTPKPLNVYARTKWEGERVVSKVCPEALIIRTNIYGFSARPAASFAEWIIQSCVEGKPVSGFTNVYFTPLYVRTLIEAVMELIEKNQSGLFHLTCGQRLSKYDFIRTLVSVFGLEGKNITPSAYDAGRLKAKRPLDMSLSAAKATSVLSTKLLNPAEGILRMKRDWEQSRNVKIPAERFAQHMHS